jgi:superkiller protein 3
LPGITTMARDRRVLALGLVLILVIGVVIFFLARGDGSEQERAQAAVDEGLAAHAAGDLATAEEAYRRAIELDPQNPFAYYNLGVIAQSEGELADAEFNYRTAIDLDPAFVEALFNLAILRADAGASDEAIELYERVIEEQPEYAAAHLNLGFLLIAEGEEEAGQAALDEAVRLDPSLEDRISQAQEEPEGETG